MTSRTINYTATRIDNGVPMTGVLKIGILKNDALLAYGYATWIRTTPTAQAAKWQPILETMQHLLFYHVQPTAPAVP